MTKSPQLSVVVPLYNEEENVKPLFDAVEEALEGISYELILVDDGSSDTTIEEILKLKADHVRLLEFPCNFGQTSAMAAGIAASKGELVVTIDGDLQNDPTDIPMMMKLMEDEGLDMVAGRRKKRKDDPLRTLVSKVANRIIHRLSKVAVKDYGCTLKLFKGDLARELDLYGELHRFIPILASMRGAKIKEVDVKHHPRQFGVSKYGFGRTLKVASDILLMAFFIRYRQKPMHLFGSVGIGMGGLGSLILTYLLFLKLLGEDIGTRPLLFTGIVLVITGVQLITTGFIAELLMRTYYRSANRKPYVVAKEYKAGKQVAKG